MSRTFTALIESGRMPTPVDCGTCPVSMACAVGAGGTGWTFDCCRSTSVRVGNQVYVLDCQRHSFEQCTMARECKACPLCSGDVVSEEDAIYRYVPTVHARFTPQERLHAWRKTARTT